MWVKICGNTNLDDCLHAAECGADAVGFIFAPGKRTVSVAAVAAITPHLPPMLEKIGVFTSNDLSEIVSSARAAGLTGVQLHGTLDLMLLEQVRHALEGSTPRFRVIQVSPWWIDRTASDQEASFTADLGRVIRAAYADTILVDSRTEAASGGTGQSFDWGAVKQTLRAFTCDVAIAGGLRPGNVAAAIQTLHPWGVDVSSGVESAPGKKDPKLVEEFLRDARTAT